MGIVVALLFCILFSILGLVGYETENFMLLLWSLIGAELSIFSFCMALI